MILSTSNINSNIIFDMYVDNISSNYLDPDSHSCDDFRKSWRIESLQKIACPFLPLPNWCSSSLLLLSWTEPTDSSRSPREHRKKKDEYPSHSFLPRLQRTIVSGPIDVGRKRLCLSRCSLSITLHRIERKYR